jgi:phosphatidylserine/phosphatidylglycerophosphate/cardiolipin synthase-like enzyme
MLVYRNIETKEILVRFLSTDGRAMPEVDDAFARKDGIKQMNLADQLASSEGTEAPQDAPLRLKFREVAKQAAASEKEVAPLAASVEELRHKVLRAEEKLDETDAGKDILREQLARLQKELDSKTDELRRHTNRMVQVYEHPVIFDQALVQCQSRLLVVSPWITDQAMDRPRLDKLRDLAKRGVEVLIGYGIGDEKEKRQVSGNALAELERLSQTYKNFHFVYLGDTHAKILIKDSDFVVTTSFNWMSFKGDRNKKFREEMGTLSHDPVYIEEWFQHYNARFGEIRIALRPQ